MQHEHLSGTGTLYKGERRVGQVQYLIRATSPEDASEGLGKSRGVIVMMEGSPGTDLYCELDADALTLHLEDGRRWNCAIERSDGTTADVAGDGLSYQP